MSLASWYRTVVAMVTKDPDRYRKADKEIWMLIASVFTLTYYMMFAGFLGIDVLSDIWLYITSGIIISSVSMAIPFVSTVSKLYEIRRSVDEELDLAVVAAAGAAATGLEFVELLGYLGSRGSRSLRGLAAIGSWFSKLSELVGYPQALLIVSGAGGSTFRRIVREYSGAISLGTSLEYLSSLSRELIYSASQRLSAMMRARGQITITAVSILVIVAIIVAGLSTFLGAYILQSIYPLIPIASALAIPLIPKYPLPLRLSISGRERSIIYTLNIAGASIAITLITTGIFTGSLMPYAKQAGVIMLIAGIYGLYLFMRAIRDLYGLGRIISQAREHVRVYRSLILFHSEDFEKIISRGVKPKLAEYLSEVFGFFREKGDMDPIIFETFAEYINTMITGVRIYMVSIMITVFIIIFSPQLVSSAIMLGGVKGFDAEAFQISMMASIALVGTKASLGELLTLAFIGAALLAL